MNFIYTNDPDTIMELKKLGFKIVSNKNCFTVFDMAGQNIDRFDSIDKSKVHMSNLMTFGR